MTEQAWPELVATATGQRVRDLLAAGADPDATATTEQQRSSAALIAARSGNLEALDALIEAGADINAQNRISLNPFLWACLSGDVDTVRRMVEAGADTERLTRFGGVGIHPAAERGHVDVVRFLAESTDINVNHTNLCGWTPLLEAVILGDGGPGQQEIVKILLRAGADPKLTDQWGVEPLEHARQMGFAAIALILEADEA